ncbi:uncharacterized protein EV422DRAFT_360878 [Fimicolochytrium jonesii]|uniref:uncharacterized protein n=1 Tax=Fimicolochytrium jonesii TaxID=1396493 RepID=UPI0022FDBE92|nr:uncharacterized protein EV422DRAFT_360878 [Fimicolochytrium jonesii]KAI8823572.1 hypothetical protein EV422DRAFT_360878 [Fimicolochytrium jonesii]
MITYSDDDVTDHFNGTATCGTVEPPVMGSVPDPFFQNSYADQMISSANPDDGTAETDFIDEVRDGCDAEGGNCHPVSSLHRRAVVSGKGRDCPIAVIADYKFYSTFGDDSEMAVLSLFNEVDSIYSQTVNVRTPVSYIYVVKNVTDASGFGKPAADAESLLSQLATAVAGRKIPKLPTNVCLTHLLTVQDFNPTLGLAYVGKQGMAGGICSGGGYNTGISTPMYGTKLIARSTYITTVTHELGHGMGSAHDTQHPTPPGNPASCNPAQPYIMYPSASTSTNWRTFSNCSLYSIGAALNSIASCFITRNSLKGLAENSTADVWYTEKIKSRTFQMKTSVKLQRAWRTRPPGDTLIVLWPCPPPTRAILSA